MPLIVVPDDFPVVLAGRKAFERLRELGELRHYDTRPDGEDALIGRIRKAEVVVNIRGYTKFTPGVLRAANRLKLLSIWGTGTDNVDLAAARDCGVTVTNTPNTATDSIAEHTLITKLDNVILTPHLAGQVPEALDRGLNAAVDNVAIFLGGQAKNVVH